MPNDMVCHVPEGELRVKQSDGMEFVAKKGDVWTCKKGIGEDLENVGSMVAIMLIIVCYQNEPLRSTFRTSLRRVLINPAL